MKKCFLLFALTLVLVEQVQSAEAADALPVALPDFNGKLLRKTYYQDPNFLSLTREKSLKTQVSNFTLGNNGVIDSRIEFGFLSMNNARGGKSRYANQDAASIVSLGRKDTAPIVCTVCDGHGTEPQATKIAQSVTQEWPQFLLNEKKLKPDSAWSLDELYNQAAKKLQFSVAQLEEGMPAGTTMTSVIIHRNNATFANVGDSRSVLIRDGKIIFATQDHKPNNPNELRRIKDAGQVVYRHNGAFRTGMNGLAVSRTLGDSQDRPSVIETPDVATYKTLPGDVIVLATDGLWDIINNDQLADYVARCFQENPEMEMQIIVNGLMHELAPEDGQMIQSDDITILMIKIK